jgi:transposase-like protein
MVKAETTLSAPQIHSVHAVIRSQYKTIWNTKSCGCFQQTRMYRSQIALSDRYVTFGKEFKEKVKKLLDEGRSIRDIATELTLRPALSKSWSKESVQNLHRSIGEVRKREPLKERNGYQNSTEDSCLALSRSGPRPAVVKFNGTSVLLTIGFTKTIGRGCTLTCPPANPQPALPLESTGTRRTSNV